FSRDGQYIVSGSADGTIKLWRAAWEDWVAYACGWLRLEPDFVLPASERESKQEQDALQGAVKACLDYGNWQDTEKADFLVRQGLAIARTKQDIEDIKEPMGKFKEARNFNPTIDLQKEQQKAINYVEKRLITASEEQAKEGNLKTVKAKLNKLEQLESNNPQLDLAKLRTKLITQVAQTWLREAAEELATFDFIESAEAKFAAVEQLISTEKLEQQEVYDDDSVKFLVNQGQKIAKRGSIKGTILLYQKAEKLKPNLKIAASYWNSLCRFGAIYGYAKDVLAACEKAVNNAPDDQKTGFQDSRGLARALNEDRQGAIKDFEVYVKDSKINERSKKQREEWIKDLKKGNKIDSIFTKEVLEELKNQ
ncbi:MAG TPA: hypothetical protein DCF68_22565, partial [Cyanothece sp. UBA12306]|nr:hypothetical protein [Cyanothece sp. UBA12306]